MATKLKLFFDKRDLFVFIKAPKHGSVCKRYLNDVVPYFPFISNKYIVLRGYSYFYSIGDDRFTECPKVKNIEMHITALILAYKLFYQFTSSLLISWRFESNPEPPVYLTYRGNFCENYMLLKTNNQKVSRELILDQIKFFLNLKASRKIWEVYREAVYFFEVGDLGIKVFQLCHENFCFYYITLQFIINVNALSFFRRSNPV